MEDGEEGGLSFDFEGGLDASSIIPTASVPLVPAEHGSVAAPSTSAAPVGVNATPESGAAGQVNRRSFRQTVCRHWLRSLCMKGDACGFLHQYDKSRMPICRFFRLYGECREQDCVYKHTNEDIKECNMYKLGFCPNGPDCRYRHAKLPGPPPPVEEVYQKIQSLSSFNYGSSNRFFQHRTHGYSHSLEKAQIQQNSAAPKQETIAKLPTMIESSNVEQRNQLELPQFSQPQDQNVLDGLTNQQKRTCIAPLPHGSSRYFIVKSCNRENLELSVQQGVWATQRSNEAKLNEAFDSSDNVILIFSINRTRHFQGCAKMTSRIGGSIGGGNWKYAHGTPHYGRNFPVKWLKLCELSFHKTRHLRNPYNENLPVKISRDCQELESSVGEQLASLLYLEPDSELMDIWSAAESKRAEEKAKGFNPGDRAGDPDIVPFDDNEEDEEEESDEDEESSGQNLPQGKGRGRGVLWPPLIPLGRGLRPPMPGMRGFPPAMMGMDGFGYGGLTPEGFPMHDLFGIGPRAYAPYGHMGPRFANDLSGLSQSFNAMDGAAAAMFHSRPQHAAVFSPGLGVMGAGRGPFMGVGAASRANWPIGGMVPFRPPLPPGPPPNIARASKKDLRNMPNSDQGKVLDTQCLTSGEDDEVKCPRSRVAHGGKYENSFRNDDSESEDEAPRRSRHGEGKRRRRSSDGDRGYQQWQSER